MNQVVPADGCQCRGPAAHLRCRADPYVRRGTGVPGRTSSASSRIDAGCGGVSGKVFPGICRSAPPAGLDRSDRRRRRSRRHAAGGARHRGVASAAPCFCPPAASDSAGLASSSVELRRRRSHGRVSLLPGIRRCRVDPGRGARRHPRSRDARRQHRRRGPPIRIAGRRPRRAHLRRSRARVVARRRRDRGPAGLGDESGRGLADELGGRSLRRRRRALPRSRLRHGSLGSHRIRLPHAGPVSWRAGTTTISTTGTGPPSNGWASCSGAARGWPDTRPPRPPSSDARTAGRVLDWGPRPSLDKLTREQMIAEFGDTGVQNPAVIDLITLDQASDTVVLVMTERRPWDATRSSSSRSKRSSIGTWATCWTAFSPSSTRNTWASRCIRLECAEAAARRGGAIRRGDDPRLRGPWASLRRVVLPPVS